MTEATAPAAPATTAAPAVAAPAAASAAAPATAPNAPSLLAAANTPDPIKLIPDKFHVKGADGQIDITASTLKALEHRDHLEKRLGSGDIRPKSADEYTFTPSEEAAPLWNAEDPGFVEFRAKAHEAGLTQAQYQFVLNEYLSRAPALITANQAIDQEASRAALAAEWKSPDVFQANLGAAYKATQVYAGDAADAVISKFGNDPDFIKLMARIGAEMGEDSSVDGQPITEADFEQTAKDLRTQLQQLPIGDKTRPAVQAKLDALYQKRYPARRR